MPRSLGQRFWCKLSTPVGEVRVYVCKEVIHADGDDCHSIYDSGAHAIYVAVNDNIDVMKKNLFHELLHNCFDGISTIQWCKMFGLVTEKVFEVRQEETVTFLEDRLYDLLTRNGMLKIPKPPQLRQKV